MDVLVSMPYDEPEYAPVYDTIVAAAAAQGLVAERVDRAAMYAEPIPARIQKAIRECRLMVAEVTLGNPNVLNEIGWAQALDKPVVMICHCEPEALPFNVQQLDAHQYDLGDLAALDRILRRVLKGTTSARETLRTMLVPGSLGPVDMGSRFVIAASPLSFSRAHGKPGRYKKLRRTASDYVGIAGILQAFGVIYQFDTYPDLVDPEDYVLDDDDLRFMLAERMNIYCIGSPKSNYWTGLLLGELQKRWAPSLSFRADPTNHNLRSVRVSLHINEALYHPAPWNYADKEDRYYADFGIIVRAPNPFTHDDQMVTLLAGRSSLGTEAACMAFTDPEHIALIRRRLEGCDVDLEKHSQPFYVIVSMERTHDELWQAMPSTLKVRDAQPLSRLQ
ncbi:MAG: hypothetical protein KKI08_13070 [Armatimonadetes bacterium]|nr:hypothetical protein [Armatimonadota bacterium]